MEKEEKSGLDGIQEKSCEVEQHDLDWLEDFPFYYTKELEDEVSIQGLIEETILLSEHLPSFIEEEEHDLEHTSLSNDVDFELKPTTSKILPRVDSFDELLATLSKEEGPLTMEEELKWQAIIQGEVDVVVADHSSCLLSSPKPSRGCPIRNIAHVEANEKEQPYDNVDPKHHGMYHFEHNQLIFSLDQLCFTNQERWVSDFIFFLGGMLQSIDGYLIFLHIFWWIHNQVEHCTLARRGSYFSKPINGFV